MSANKKSKCYICAGYKNVPRNQPTEIHLVRTVCVRQSNRVCEACYKNNLKMGNLIKENAGFKNRITELELNLGESKKEEELKMEKMKRTIQKLKKEKKETQVLKDSYRKSKNYYKEKWEGSQTSIKKKDKAKNLSQNNEKEDHGKMEKEFSRLEQDIDTFKKIFEGNSLFRRCLEVGCRMNGILLAHFHNLLGIWDIKTQRGQQQFGEVQRRFLRPIISQLFEDGIENSKQQVKDFVRDHQSPVLEKIRNLDPTLPSWANRELSDKDLTTCLDKNQVSHLPPLVCGIDTTYSHRNNDSDHALLSVIELITGQNLLIHCEMMWREEVDDIHKVEEPLIKRALRKLSSEFNLVSVCHDGNKSKILKDEYPKTIDQLDGFHVKKGMMKGYKTFCTKNTKCKRNDKRATQKLKMGTRERLLALSPSISSHFYRCLEFCEGSNEKLAEAWSGYLDHLLGNHGNCIQSSQKDSQHCQDPHVKSMKTLNAEEFNQVSKFMNNKKRIEKIQACSLNLSTSFNESFFNVCNVYRDKRIHYRCYDMLYQMAALDWMENRNREAKYRYSIKSCRMKKNHTLRKERTKLEEKTFHWQKAAMERFVSAYLQFKFGNNQNQQNDDNLDQNPLFGNQDQISENVFEIDHWQESYGEIEDEYQSFNEEFPQQQVPNTLFNVDPLSIPETLDSDDSIDKVDDEDLSQQIEMELEPDNIPQNFPQAQIHDQFIIEDDDLIANQLWSMISIDEMIPLEDNGWILNQILDLQRLHLDRSWVPEWKTRILSDISYENWLIDEDINRFILLLLNNQSLNLGKRILFFNCCSPEQMILRLDPQLISTFDIVGIPIQTHNHWILFICFVQQKRIEIWDSGSSPFSETFGQRLATLLKFQIFKIVWSNEPLQPNADDCGSFLCLFAYLRVFLNWDISFIFDNVAPQTGKQFRSFIARCFWEDDLQQKESKIQEVRETIQNKQRFLLQLPRDRWEEVEGELQSFRTLLKELVYWISLHHN